MNSKELAEYLDIGERAVRKATNEAKKKGEFFFWRKGERIEFELTEGIGGNGKIYKYSLTKKVQRTMNLDIQTKVIRSESIKKAELRARVCMLYERRWGTCEEFMAELPVEFESLRLDRLKLLRMVAKYREAVRCGEDPVKALVDKRGRVKGMVSLSEEHKESIERFLLRRDIRPTMAGIYKNLKAMYEDIPSLDTVVRYAKEFKRKNRLLYEISRDPDGAKNKYMPAFGSRSEKAMFVNHYWELDGTPADVVCADGKRWAIVGLIDIHTRRVALNLEETNTSYAVARNLRHGLLKLGVPENVVIDNGKDYTSEHMDSCFVSLGINAIRTPPYSGEYKPHIERFFGTLARQLFREMEGFLGHNVSEREKIKSGLSFGDRLEAVKQWREKNKDEENFVKLWKKGKMYAGLEIEVPLTSEELEVALESYVEMYENNLHSGIGMTPMQKYAQGEANRIVSDRSLDFLLGESKQYRVRKDGIQIVEDGVKFIYMANELYEYIGMQVRIVKLEKLDEIAVYDSDNELICVAVDPTYSGKSRENFKVAAKRWKRAAAKADKAVREATRLAREKDMTIMDRLHIDRIIEESTGESDDVQSYQVSREELGMSGERPMFFKDMVDMFEWMALHPNEWRENDKLVKEENEELYESIEKRVRFSRRAS